MYKIIASDNTFQFESFKNFQLAEIVERSLQKDYRVEYPDGRVYECKFLKDA